MFYKQVAPYLINHLDLTNKLLIKLSQIIIKMHHCALIVFVTGILFLIFFFVILPKIDSYNPPPIEFNITEASIIQFNLTSNNTLYYNFKLNITARNSNNNSVTYYDTTTAISSYKNNNFAWASLAPFVVGSMNTILLEPLVFEGNSEMKLEPQQLVEYNNETRLRIYNIDLELDTFPPSVYCPNLRVPLIFNANTFNVTTCS